MEKYDLIVAGGGFTGVAAAVCAAREGVRVLLIDKSAFLGGAACNCYVNPFMSWRTEKDGKRFAISDGIFTEMLERMRDIGAFLDDSLRLGSTFNEELLKLVMDRMTAEAGVDVLLHSFISHVEKEGERIVSVATTGKSGEHTFFADYFIDATGDADVATLAGCPTHLGREDNMCQPMTLCFRLSGVDVEKVYELRESIQSLYRQYREEGKIKNPREDVMWFRHTSDGVLHLNSTRVIRLNPVDVFDLTKAEREAREQMYELFLFLKNNFEPFRNCRLLSSAPEIGVRESRMIVGEYVLDTPEMKACTKFADSIAACRYDIDIHSPDGAGTSHYYFEKGTYYTIPYRCLLPKNAENLLVAGRCISSTHEAQASYRIMPVCTTLGQAAGSAIAVAKNSGVAAVKQVDVAQLQALLKKNGAFIGV